MKCKQTDFNAFITNRKLLQLLRGVEKRTPKNAVDAVAWKLTVLETKKLHVRYYISGVMLLNYQQDVGTESEKLTSEESTSEGVTD